MKEPPAGLPPANSRTWHSRRWWDSLGYLRVRSLSNPEWQRDSQWLAHRLTAERRSAPEEEGELYDAAIVAARRYPRTASGTVDADASWDEVLTAIDRLLVMRQERHLAQVRDAQRESRAGGRGLSDPE
ncbi:MAG: hypothetical protein JWP40_1534 [Blastococcus sp.]|nr:hypothetical protein [Blastococcus sp.]